MVLQSKLLAALSALLACAAAERTDDILQVLEADSEIVSIGNTKRKDDDHVLFVPHMVDDLEDYFAAKEALSASPLVIARQAYILPLQRNIVSLFDNLVEENEEVQQAKKRAMKNPENKRNLCRFARELKRKCITSKKYTDLMAQIDLPGDSIQFVSTAKDHKLYPGAYIGLYIRHDEEVEGGHPVYRGPNSWRLRKDGTDGQGACQWIFSNSRHNQFSLPCKSVDRAGKQDWSVNALAGTQEWGDWPGHFHEVTIAVDGAFKRNSYDAWRQAFKAANEVRCQANQKAVGACKAREFGEVGVPDRHTATYEEVVNADQYDCSEKQVTFGGKKTELFLEETYPMRAECGKCSVLKITHAQAGGTYRVIKEEFGHPFFEGPPGFRLNFKDGRWLLGKGSHNFWWTDHDEMNHDELDMKKLSEEGKVGIECIGERK